ncbi:MAG: hypothetical protein IT245_01175 [Bacteroidia bacterium]|nr:hypothetical protein [Bacteroidia bacterium]
MKELEDHTWFPDFLRVEQAEFIGQMAVFSGIYKPFIQLLKNCVHNSDSLHDLCSGSGVPGLHIFNASTSFKSLTLSDKFPLQKQWPDNIRYLSISTDILEMEFTPQYCYILLNAFHHFNEEEQNSIIKRCQEAGAEMYIAEILEPTLMCAIKVFLAGTIGVLLLTPFICKMTWRKFILTYLIPLNSITVSIDGIISVFKSKSQSRYINQLAKDNKQLNVLRLSNLAGPSIILHLQACA